MPPAPETSADPGRLRPLHALALGVAVFVLGVSAVVLSPAADVSVWWPAAGVAVAVAVGPGRGSRRRVLAVVLVSAAAANLAGGRPPLVALGFGIGNACEVAVAAGLLLRDSGGARPQLVTAGDLGRLLTATCSGAATAASVAYVTVALLEHGDLDAWESVAFAHGAAVLVVVPLALRAVAPVRVPRREVLAQWLLGLGTTAAVFAPAQHLPLAFLALPALLWGGLRGGVHRVAAQLLAVGALATVLTGHGGGAFSAPDRPEVLTDQLVQLFLVSTAVGALALAVAAGAQRSALDLLAERKHFDDAVLETVSAGVLACDADGHVVLRNGAQRRLTGVGRDEQVSAAEVSARITVLHDDGSPLPLEREPLLLALAGEEVTDLPVRIGARGRALRDVRITARQIRAGDGRLLGAVAALNDVTGEREVQDELRRGAAFHDAVLAASPDVVHVLDAVSGATVWTSRTLTELLGYTPAEVAALGDGLLAALVHPDDVVRVLASTTAARGLPDGQVVQLRYRVRDSEGAYRWLSRRVTPFVRDTAGEVVQLLAVARDVTTNVHLEQQLAEAALHDELTGLPNRRLLADRLSTALSRTARTGWEVAVLFCDLDGFKQVNDTGGHAAGDAVLVAAAARLLHVLRPQDTVARVGGDEFVVLLEPSPPETGPGGELLPGRALREEVGAVAERVQQALGVPVDVDGVAHRVTVSIGISFASSGDDPELALRAADSAMYRAKSAGKDRAEVAGVLSRA